MYGNLTRHVLFRTLFSVSGLVSRMLAATAALSLAPVVVTGAETADVRGARAEGLGGIVLDMGKEASALQLPQVSGTLSGAVTLVDDSTSLVGTKKQKLKTESESQTGSTPSDLSNYKKSFYSPALDISGVHASWTWSLAFAVHEDISLVQTQVAFFSCDRTLSSKSCKETDFIIGYRLEICEAGNSLASVQGTETLSGSAEACEACEAGYDFATGEITSGSGAVVTVDWQGGVLLEQGHTYTYSMTVSYADQASTDSTGVGFGGIRFMAEGGNEPSSANIPEAAPAALFLLSLVFAVRRRRRVARA